MWGNMKEVVEAFAVSPADDVGREGVGCDVPVVDAWVVLDGKLGKDAELDSDDGAGIGCSKLRRLIASAPTMPPILCPQRITWTDGSIVGDGVELSTSISITLF